MEHATPEERQALMAKIVASRTSSGGAVEEEGAEDGDMPRGGSVGVPAGGENKEEEAPFMAGEEKEEMAAAPRSAPPPPTSMVTTEWKTARHNYERCLKTQGRFLERAVALVKRVVEDRLRPVSSRVFNLTEDYAPICVVVEGLCLRLAMPTEDSPFLSSHELSNKATGHNLRSGISICQAIEDEVGSGENMNLNAGLSIVVDYLGYRVHVTRSLDLVDKGSLKVGSDDMCKTLPHGNGDDTERAVNKDMSAVARHIGLAVHGIGHWSTLHEVRLGFGATVKAHIDKHGIGRVLDTARVFPPEDYMTTTWKNGTSACV
jgi:hypothetical protein